MTDAGASAAVLASTSAAVLHALGLDAYVLALACVGAVMLQAWSDKTTGRWRAMLQVATSGLSGALVTQATVDYLHIDSRSAVLALAAFLGFAAFDIFTALASRSDSLIGTLASRWGGKK